MNLHQFRPRRRLPRPLALFIAVVALASVASAEWKEKVLYSFQGGGDAGSLPAGGVVFDKQGNLYGVTSDGGGVYQLAPPAKQGGAWTETVLYVFKGNSEGDGATPEGGLVIDAAGNLYGTTAYGGTGDCVLLGTSVGCGTVYELSPPAQKGGQWSETVLYSFLTSKQGYFPWGNLVFDGAGNLYGATDFGGGKGTTCDPYYQYCGTVFELSPPKTKGGKWTEKVLHSFAGGTDGANPNGGLVLGNTGAIYGTTYSGGNQDCNYEGESGCGTAFELQPPNEKNGVWKERILHHFDRTTSDGGNPAAGLRFDTAGNLYGTTLNGGPGLYGTVFSLRPPSKATGAWIETILHGFNDDERGAGPSGPLVFDGSGALYGTTAIATSRLAQGNVFRMRPPSMKGGAWALSVVHTFTGNPDGASPSANLVFSSSGSIFSTTQEGGAAQACQGGCGTVFKVSP